MSLMFLALADWNAFVTPTPNPTSIFTSFYPSGLATIRAHMIASYWSCRAHEWSLAASVTVVGLHL